MKINTKLTKGENKILLIYVLLLIVISLFPPWSLDSGKTLGVYFIFDHPDLYRGHIDFGLLFLRLAVISGIFIFVILCNRFLFKNPLSGSEARTKVAINYLMKLGYQVIDPGEQDQIYLLSDEIIEPKMDIETKKYLIVSILIMIGIYVLQIIKEVLFYTMPLVSDYIAKAFGGFFSIVFIPFIIAIIAKIVMKKRFWRVLPVCLAIFGIVFSISTFYGSYSAYKKYKMKPQYKYEDFEWEEAPVDPSDDGIDWD